MGRRPFFITEWHLASVEYRTYAVDHIDEIFRTEGLKILKTPIRTSCTEDRLKPPGPDPAHEHDDPNRGELESCDQRGRGPRKDQLRAGDEIGLASLETGDEQDACDRSDSDPDESWLVSKTCSAPRVWIASKPTRSATSDEHQGLDPMKRSLPIDKTDMASLPMFALTMFAEARELKNRPVLREHGDLDDWSREELSDPSLPADPLAPVGYERNDTRASLLMLAGNITINLAISGVLGRVNRGLFDRRVTTIDGRRGSFIAAMVAWDFLYYWSHRWQHEKRVFWANHVVHHSSEHYNLSTALRQPWSGFLLSWVYFPMPLLGFSPALTAKAGQLNLLYQYWIHTETIDRLSPATEGVLNTPSHHRVHHGANPQYLDRNYAGILITWDKLFGTFEPEVRRVKYGLTKNINTFNPFRIAYGEFADIARDVRAASGWRNKIGHVWKPPGWQPDYKTKVDSR